MEQQPIEPTPKRPIFKVIGILALLVIGVGGYFAWSMFFKPNVPATLTNKYLLVPSGSSLDQVLDSLNAGHFILDEKSFRMMAERLSYNGRGGRFEIAPGMSSFNLVKHLRSGKQAPVKVVLVNERLPEHIAAKVARFIEPDSLALVTLLNDTTYLDSIGMTPQTLLSMFIPNTYEFFWNTSPRKFMERMKKEHDRFWAAEGRDSLARSLGLSREEVYTVASIVERETNANSEKKRMAGVYLNRVEQGWPLQADPTLVFASRDWEARDLAKYKDLDSPYNTYKYPGLPPGPISMASIPSLDAVLNREPHKYMFFVAKGDGSGTHMFAETYDAHKVNIEVYKRNLIGRGLGL
ncbi:MAG: endolytic transglycosylase MltG [Saprospiraceae bacterium]|nr:endolytic transglycosylase MltG [Saprospiraceae bacterium]MCF8249608.1 endolytic transglycosylase MltG [Saprospiraceae bacterium]MCF8280508.1 endolytic transglycosylase MltG [Bacteroidales bacterium]MCF8310440.1 endolytic transglycosylase MltG [Saprospiraceae bacterium]MCF8439818.1 endolytic transglycosylase MltG [Saprospiraceae bacterium]